VADGGETALQPARATLVSRRIVAGIKAGFDMLPLCHKHVILAVGWVWIFLSVYV
jgi:hypothetical protein